MRAVRERERESSRESRVTITRTRIPPFLSHRDLASRKARSSRGETPSLVNFCSRVNPKSGQTPARVRLRTIASRAKVHSRVGRFARRRIEGPLNDDDVDTRNNAAISLFAYVQFRPTRHLPRARWGDGSRRLAGLNGARASRDLTISRMVFLSRVVSRRALSIYKYVCARPTRICRVSL